MAAMTKKNPVLFIFRIGFIVLLANVGIAFSYMGYRGVQAAIFVLGMVKVISEEKAFLLHRVDFEVLREATDQLHEQTLKANALTGHQYVRYLPDNKDVPPALRILKPTHISVENERAFVEFGGGMYHFGILVYTPGAKETGQRKLADRVWFYSD
jgi:hypothetical protein